MAPTEKEVLAALSELVDSVTGRNFVESKSVKNVKIEGESVALDVALGYPARGVLEKVRGQVAERLKAIPGVAHASVNVYSRIVPHSVQRGVKLIPGIKNIIAVASGKGGVGKSTTAVNLALALAAEGASVGMLDADIYGPSQPLMLGITGRPTSKDGKSMEPMEGHGVQAMSVGFLIEADTPMVWRGPMVTQALEQLLTETKWRDLDYLVVDLPPGTGDVSLSMAQSVPVAGAVVVTTPQGVSVSDVRKAVAMFRQLNIPVLGVVENMSYFVCGHCQEKTEIFGHGGGAKMAEDMGIPLLGEIPIDTRVRAGGDEGRPIVSAAPDAPAAKAFFEIAGRVAAEISKQNARVLKVIQTA